MPHYPAPAGRDFAALARTMNCEGQCAPIRVDYVDQLPLTLAI